MFGAEKIVIHFKDGRPPETIEKGFASKYIRNDEDLYTWFTTNIPEKEIVPFLKAFRKSMETISKDRKGSE